MIRCFWIEPMELAQVQLRRFSYGSRRQCPANGKLGCDASVIIEPVRIPKVWLGEDGERQGGYGRRPGRSIKDPRWPTVCKACGQPFQPEDEWQRHVDQFYTDGTRRWTLQTYKEEPPPGAMWHAWWHDDIWPGPDGRCIAVMTPAGTWEIDGPDMHGNRCWTRSGNPPDLVVSPSIVIGDKYHGWLGNGGAPPGYLKPC